MWASLDSLHQMGLNYQSKPLLSSMQADDAPSASPWIAPPSCLHLINAGPAGPVCTPALLKRIAPKAFYTSSFAVPQNTKEGSRPLPLRNQCNLSDPTSTSPAVSPIDPPKAIVDPSLLESLDSPPATPTPTTPTTTPTEAPTLATAVVDSSVLELSSVTIPDHAFVGLLNSADVEDDDDSITAGHADDMTVPTTNVPLHLTAAYDNHDYDSPRAQIDSGAKSSVTDKLWLLHFVEWFSPSNPSPVKMYGATNRNILITPLARGILRIPALTARGYADITCYYSPKFSSTLLSEADLLLSTGDANDHSGQTTSKTYAPDLAAINAAIERREFELEKY